MSIGKVSSVRTVHNIPVPGYAPGRAGFVASEVESAEIVNVGVVYTFEGKRRLIPWSNVKHVELVDETAQPAPGPARRPRKPSEAPPEG